MIEIKKVNKMEIKMVKIKEIILVKQILKKDGILDSWDLEKLDE